MPDGLFDRVTISTAPPYLFRLSAEAAAFGMGGRGWPDRQRGARDEVRSRPVGREFHQDDDEADADEDSW